MTEPKTIEELKAELAHSFTICGCKGKVVTTEDGKKHFEIECKSKADREEVAAIFEEEAILRVNPKMVLEEPPAEALETPPAPEPAPETES